MKRLLCAPGLAAVLSGCGEDHLHFPESGWWGRILLSNESTDSDLEDFPRNSLMFFA
jgi:hypothetical protein